MAVGPQEYRDAACRFASGVTIVTVNAHGKPHGLTATSFTSVSLEPPLVLVCLAKDSRTRAAVLEGERFAINVLREDQEEVARSFSRAGDKTFDGIPHQLDEAGVPLLDEAITTMSCAMVSVTDAGDHDVVVGEVLATSIREGRPLLYYERDYRTF